MSFNDSPTESPGLIEDHIVKQIRHLSKEHLFKFVGGGVTESLHALAPQLCTRLWLEVCDPTMCRCRSV